MADLTVNAVTTIAYNASGNPQYQQTNLGSQRIAQVESAGLEMGRSGRSYVGGTSAVAGGQAPVTNLPTVTVAWMLYNSFQTGNIVKYLVPKRISGFFCSSTINQPATGVGVFAGVPPAIVVAASQITANASNHKTQSTRGYGPTPYGLIGTAATIPAATCWTHLGGISVLTNSNTTGPSFTVDVSNQGWIVPPQFCLAVGLLGDTTGTPLWGISIAWDEIELVLP